MNDKCCQSEGADAAACCGRSEVGSSDRKTASYLPSVDVIETADEIRIVADVPGADAAGIEITFEDRTLTMRAPVSARVVADRQAVHREYGVGDYIRTFSVNDLIDREKIEAGLTDGVLTIRLPKAEAMRPRKIRVQSPSNN